MREERRNLTPFLPNEGADLEKSARDIFCRVFETQLIGEIGFKIRSLGKEI